MKEDTRDMLRFSPPELYAAFCLWLRGAKIEGLAQAMGTNVEYLQREIGKYVLDLTEGQFTEDGEHHG